MEKTDRQTNKNGDLYNCVHATDGNRSCPSPAQPLLRLKKKKIGSSNLLEGLKRVKFHGEFNYASLMTLKWCVFKRSQKNWFFRPKTAVLGPKIGSSNLLRGLTGFFLWTVQNYLTVTPKIFAFRLSRRAVMIDNLLTFTLLQRNGFRNIILVLFYPFGWEAHFR